MPHRSGAFPVWRALDATHLQDIVIRGCLKTGSGQGKAFLHNTSLLECRTEALVGGEDQCLSCLLVVGEGISAACHSSWLA